jgi:hypothetical protein
MKNRWVIKFDHIPSASTSDSLAICIEPTEEDIDVMRSNELTFNFYDSEEGAAKLLKDWINIDPSKTDAELVVIERSGKIIKYWSLYGVLNEEVKSEDDESNKVQKITTKIHYDHITNNKIDS